MKFNIIKICYDTYLVFCQPNKPYMNDINKKNRNPPAPYHHHCHERKKRSEL